MKKVVRLNESDLNKIVEESVKQIIKENPNNEGLRNLFGFCYYSYNRNKIAIKVQ